MLSLGVGRTGCDTGHLGQHQSMEFDSLEGGGVLWGVAVGE